ncbi:sugar ABC transporter ATP-binding protein [Variovorax sp. UMC13]|uniref:sugar ABC transporter ATP-binding protein n=1 Tax=Variovorax sp. UMC13 TaxID=1862326 RepID=UPI001604A04E|nr:sugar ABC transporter ATP-binding protein [Variovorax sp. UMC13]MBB1603556.1 sugar ABC transporter ATP-binding protein [Variovorax sp. UMC13]
MNPPHDPAAPATPRVPILELRGISKRFTGVQALDDVSFELHEGEVHMLLGENGAGKSTLMKVLCGAHTADAGEFFHHGKPVVIGGPADAQRLGIAVIFQEFTLVPYLSVAQNIFLGREPRGRLPGLVDHARMRREAQAIMDQLGMTLAPDTVVATLGVAQQQMVEIAKALSQQARIVVLDEPTAALSDNETEKLFAMIETLKRQGVAMVYISHRMAEVFSMGDRITVLRDGRKVGFRMPGQTAPDELVSLMVGRKVDMSYSRTYCTAPGEMALRLQGVSARSGIQDVSLEVRAGEIVGLAGLVGSGRTEVARAIFGADPIAAGRIEIFGRPQTGGPTQARRLGAALIPESRKAQGLALIRSVGENLVLASLPRLFPRGLFSPSKAAAQARELIARLRIATPGPDRRVGVLSGGNQQKVVIGKWLSAEAKLFIFDEPTRGIDVGAKAEIFSLIDGLVKKGAAVLMISSELSEIVNVCDRTYVMREGRVAGELARDAMSEEAILTLGMHHA